MRWRRRLAILMAALALFAAACSKSSDEQAEPTETAQTGAPEPTETATVKPTDGPTEEPSPAPTEEPILEDGRHFVFPEQWDNLEDGSGRMTFDLAYFLVGEAANEAAAEHGDEIPVPNDYYIVNDNPKLRQLPVAADAKILVIDWDDCCELKKLDMLQFGSIMVDGDPSGSYYGTDSIYWITVKDETIVKIEEQYTP